MPELTWVRGRGSRVVTWLLAVVGLGLVITGAAAWLERSDRDQRAEEAGSPTSAAVPSQPPRREPSGLPTATRVAREPGAPLRLRIPGLGLDAPVVPIAAPGGVLTPPADPQVLGWWAAGAEPGAERGSALVTGHTVHTGGGAMDDLEQVSDRDRVWIRTRDGRIGYRVSSVVVLGKGELARRADRLFDQSTAGRLVLITCEDWNGTEYLSNVVVTATPLA